MWKSPTRQSSGSHTVSGAAGKQGTIGPCTCCSPPSWIWHRTRDWYPDLLAAGVELERCYDISLCGNILAFSQFSAHTEYARNAVTMPVDDPLLPPKALLPPRPP